MPLDLAQLRVFHEAGRGDGYTAAARRLHVTQSAVSHAMRKLEDGLGVALVERRGRRLALTEEGAELHAVCRDVFAALDDAERRLTARRTGVAQLVVFGATVEFGTMVLVQKLRPLLDAHPELSVAFRFSNELDGALLRDEIDLALDCAPHQHPSLLRTRLFREKYVVVAAPSFLARRPLRAPLDLRRAPVLSLDGEGLWWNKLLRALPAKRRPTLERIVPIDHVRGLINATIEGYGVGLVPKYTVLGELARGELIALFPRLRLVDDTFCVFQKRARAERAGNALLTEFLRRMDVREFGDAIGG